MKNIYECIECNGKGGSPYCNHIDPKRCIINAILSGIPDSVKYENPVFKKLEMEKVQIK